MTYLERAVLGWPHRPRAADAAMAEQWSSMHGDMSEIASRRLSSPTAWQWCDLEGDSRLETAGELRFQVDRVEDFAGLQFFNRFLFHHGHLDTGETATDWGVSFVPRSLPAAAVRGGGPAELIVTTRQIDPDQPSMVELSAGVLAHHSRPVSL